MITAPAPSSTWMRWLEASALTTWRRPMVKSSVESAAP